MTMKYIDHLRKEAETLLHHLSSTSIDKNQILSEFPMLVWSLYSQEDYETIQKLYVAYKRFYEEKIIPQFKDKLKDRNFCYKCSDSDASVLIESTILYSFVEEKLPLKEKEVASLILTFFLKGTEDNVTNKLPSFTKGFDFSELNLGEIVASFSKKGLFDSIEKFSLDNMNLTSLILFFVRNVELLERIRSYLNLLTLSEKLKNRGITYIFKELDYISFITTNLKNGIKQRLEDIFKILEKKLLATSWIDKNLVKTFFESIKISEITKYEAKISSNFSEIKKEIKESFMRKESHFNIECFFEDFRKLCSFTIIRKAIKQVIDRKVINVFNTEFHSLLIDDELIEKKFEEIIKEYSELFSSPEDEIKDEIKKVIEKVPPKLEEKIKKIIRIYETNPPNLNKKLLQALYNEFASLTKILNVEWIDNFDSIEEKDLHPEVSSHITPMNNEDSSIKEIKRRLKSLISKWEDPNLRAFFKNLFIFYQAREFLAKRDPKLVKYFDKTLYRYFAPYHEIAFLITGKVNKEFDVKLEKVLYFICSCIFLLTVASEISPCSYEFKTSLWRDEIYVRKINSIFGLSCLYLEKYFHFDMEEYFCIDNVFLWKFQSKPNSHYLSLTEMFRLGKILVKAFKRQKNNLESENSQQKDKVQNFSRRDLIPPSKEGALPVIPHKENFSQLQLFSY
ncbi:MAG: hypothetical protein ACP5QP_06815 [Brevinematia bacterium]